MSSGEGSESYPWVWSTWVKAPILKGKDLLIASACLPYVNPELFRKLAEGKTVLLACPERESPAHYGKIASMIRSSRPRSITVVTIDGSPHCFTLHASANEAEYILGEKVEKKHYVVVNGEELVEISPDAVRVARYLHIVDKLVKEHPEALQMLERVSLEYKQAKKLEKRERSNS
jgi:hypothetical protein